MIYFNSLGPSGNIFAILGAVSATMKKQRRITEYNTMRDRVFEAQSYEEALTIIREYVELIDLDKKF